MRGACEPKGALSVKPGLCEIAPPVAPGLEGVDGEGVGAVGVLTVGVRMVGTGTDGVGTVGVGVVGTVTVGIGMVGTVTVGTGTVGTVTVGRVMLDRAAPERGRANAAAAGTTIPARIAAAPASKRLTSL